MPGRQEHLQAQIYRLNILLVERLSASVVDCNAVEDILHKAIATFADADQQRVDIYTPRRLLSAIIEWDNSDSEQVPLCWDRIATDDLRVHKHARFRPGRITPIPEVTMGSTHPTAFNSPHEQSGDPGPSQRKWEKSRRIDEPDTPGTTQVTVMLKGEPEEETIPEGIPITEDIPIPKSSQATRKRQRSVSFADGLKDHDGADRRLPAKRRSLSKAAVNIDSDEEPNSPPGEDGDSCARCLRLALPCTLSKWAACDRCHQAKTRCSIVSVNHRAVTPQYRRKSPIKKAATPAPARRQTRSKKTSKAVENRVQPNVAASPRLIPYVLVPKVADLPAFQNLRGLHKPIVSTATPKGDTLQELAARMDGIDGKIEKVHTALTALLTLTESLRRRSAKVESRPETAPQSPPNELTSAVLAPSGSSLLPTYSTVSVSGQLIGTLQTARPSPGAEAAPEKVSALTEQHGHVMPSKADRMTGPSANAATHLDLHTLGGRDEGAGERGADDSNGIADETMDMDDKGGAISAEL